MINRDMRTHEVFEFQANGNEYGETKLLKNDPIDAIQIAIYVSSQAIQDNINYKSATYVGFTYNTEYLSDNFAIKYGNDFLKILYVIPGRINQIFMSEI